MGTVASRIKTLPYGLISSFHRNLNFKPSSGKESRTAKMVFRILVGTYSDAIYTLTFDPSKPEDSALSLSSTLKVGHHPSWIERHPSDPAIVFTGLEQADGRLLALKYDLSNGEGNVVAESPSGGQDPCTIVATKSHVLIGNVRITSIVHSHSDL